MSKNERSKFFKSLILGPVNLESEHEEMLRKYDEKHEEIIQHAAQMELEANREELKKLGIEVDTSLDFASQAKKAKKEYADHPSNQGRIVKALGGPEALWDDRFMQYVHRGIKAELESLKTGKEVPEEEKEVHGQTKKLFELLSRECELIGDILGLRHFTLKKHPEDERALKETERIESMINSQKEFGEALSKTARNDESEKEMEERASNALFGRVNSATVKAYDESHKKYEDIERARRVKLPDIEACLKEFVKPSPFDASMKEIMEVYEEARNIKQKQSSERTDIITKNTNDDDIITM